MTDEIGEEKAPFRVRNDINGPSYGSRAYHKSVAERREEKEARRRLTFPRVLVKRKDAHWMDPNG